MLSSCTCTLHLGLWVVKMNQSLMSLNVAAPRTSFLPALSSTTGRHAHSARLARNGQRVPGVAVAAAVPLTPEFGYVVLTASASAILTQWQMFQVLSWYFCGLFVVFALVWKSMQVLGNLWSHWALGFLLVRLSVTGRESYYYSNHFVLSWLSWDKKERESYQS